MALWLARHPWVCQQEAQCADVRDECHEAVLYLSSAASSLPSTSSARSLTSTSSAASLHFSGSGRSLGTIIFLMIWTNATSNNTVRCPGSMSSGVVVHEFVQEAGEGIVLSSSIPRGSLVSSSSSLLLSLLSSPDCFWLGGVITARDGSNQDLETEAEFWDGNRMLLLWASNEIAVKIIFSLLIGCSQQQHSISIPKFSLCLETTVHVESHKLTPSLIGYLPKDHAIALGRIRVSSLGKLNECSVFGNRILYFTLSCLWRILSKAVQQQSLPWKWEWRYKCRNAIDCAHRRKPPRPW